MTTDAEIDEKLARIERRLATEREAVEAKLAETPELLALVTEARRVFGPLRLSGDAVDRPDPVWLSWPVVKLSEMAPLPAKGESREVKTTRSRR